MMEASKGGGIHQTVLAGSLGSPWLFTMLLMAVCVLLGVCIATLQDVSRAQDRLEQRITETVRDTSSKFDREIRILQIHVQDTNAILIKKGLKAPADDETGPTSGTHP